MYLCVCTFQLICYVQRAYASADRGQKGASAHLGTGIIGGCQC